jgi:hypothetical protein
VRKATSTGSDGQWILSQRGGGECRKGEKQKFGKQKAETLKSEDEAEILKS